MKDTIKAAENVTNHLGGFPWEKMFPDLLWIAFWLLLIFITKDFIRTAIVALINRMKHGSGLKIGSFELERLNVTTQNISQKGKFEVTLDEKNLFGTLRFNEYKRHRWFMPVHKVFKSQNEGQLYDILIYLIPHGDNLLVKVKSVEYFFGKFWGNNIFKTTDRSNNFAIVTSAHGSFLCVIKINYDDGLNEIFYRYIDFEMGDVASVVNEKIKK